MTVSSFPNARSWAMQSSRPAVFITEVLPEDFCVAFMDAIMRSVRIRLKVKQCQMAERAPMNPG